MIVVPNIINRQLATGSLATYALTGNEVVDKLANSATESRLIDKVVYPSRENEKKNVSLEPQ